MTAAPPAPRPARASAPDPAQPSARLSAKAEAFRAELAASRGEAGPGFADWRRSQFGSQLMIWLLGMAFLSPGLLCLILQAPLQVSAVVEIAGIVINIWLRRERRRRRSEILAWQEASDAWPSAGV